MGTIHLMSEPAREPEYPPPSERPKVVPVDPSKMVGEHGVVHRAGVRSPDYGTGTIVAITGNGVQIYWDEALAGTSAHLLEHERWYVERLERLP